uniref:Neugrin n=1 Tax=Callorhinchus milii TaxID=7868 RepID=V9KSD3_CALMI
MAFSRALAVAPLSEGLRAARLGLRALCQASLLTSPRGWAQSRALSGREWQDEPEDKEAELEDELMRAERRRRKAIKLKQIRAEFGFSGPPERRLTQEAMQQIRFLKEEFPEEWTMERLAEGFSVSPNVIQRVLRSKFIPSVNRALKQNAKAKANAGLLKLPDRVRPQTAVMDVGDMTAVAPVIPELKLRLSQGVSLSSEVLRRAHKLPGQEAGKGVPVPMLPSGLTHLTVQDSHSDIKPPIDTKLVKPVEHGENSASTFFQSDKEQWDGESLTDEVLEELAEREVENSMKVIRKGLSFYDQEGNFLYRIQTRDSSDDPET